MDALPKVTNLKQFSQVIRVLDRCHYLTERDIYLDFLEMFVELSDSEIGYLHLFDESTEEIRFNVWSKSVLPICTTIHDSHYPLKSAGIWADSIRQRRTVVHNDYQSSASHQGLPEGHFPLSRHMSLPVFEDKRIVAILGLGNSPVDYSPDVADSVRVALDTGWPRLERCLSRLSESRERDARIFHGQTSDEILANMMGAIGRALESRDEYTADHQLKVASISGRVADALGLDEQMEFGLKLGALVHDIGKIAVPSQILSKTGKLTPPELELLKSHAATGASFFSELSMPWPIAEMIRQHHERMDGSGYPDGLVGDRICLEARIIGVADTFDAMASDRPYRVKIGARASLEYIQEQRGRAFDAYVVDGFLECHGEDPTLGGRYEAP